MKYKILGLVLMVGFLTQSVTAKNYFTEDNKRVKRHNIGVNLGLTSGMGISYRHWLQNGFGFSVTAFPYWKINKNQADVNLNGGLGLFKSFYVSNYLNFYGYLGAAYFWDYYNDKNDIDRGFYDYNEDRDIKELNIGIGPGIEFHFGFFDISTTIGMASTNENADGVYTYGITPTGEVAFFFNF